MPFPSRGCRTCKTRRIKCDEGLPTCQRCVKSHRLCSWIGVGVVYRAENYYASGHVKRPRGPRVGESRTSNIDATQQCLSTDLKEIAISHYLENYIRKPDEVPTVLKGLTDDLLSAWGSLPKRPAILDLAVASMGLAVFSRNRKYPPAALEASTKYLQLLIVVQSSIQFIHPADVDAYLLAIYLMGRYENMVYRIEENSHLSLSCASALRSFSHYDGALAILKLWKDQHSQEQPATDVIKHTRRCMIKSVLLRTLAIPGWMMDGALFGECGWELEYDRLVVQIANLRHRFSLLSRGNTHQAHIDVDTISKVRVLNEEAEMIDESLRTWIASSPIIGNLPRPTIDDWQAMDLYFATTSNYASVAWAAIGILYYSTRLFINNTKLRILDFGQLYSNKSERLEYLSQIHSIADDIAYILPFCLQKTQTAESANSTCPNSIPLKNSDGVKPSLAELAVWPLTIAASISDLEEKQRLWFRVQLANIGRMIGDRVIELDAAERWFRL